MKIRASLVTAALIAGFCGLLVPDRAQASTTYPPKVQEALSKQFGKPYCVPQCITCHLTNAGGLRTLNVFGSALKEDTALPPASPNKVGPAFTKYFMDKPNADSDGDGLSDMAELEIGSSPAIALPRGEGLICPDIKYGCGAHIAAAPPEADRVGLFSAGLAVLGLAFAVRRRRRTS